MNTMKKKLEELQVSYLDLSRGEKLGESGLGATYKGFWNVKDIAVAIKVVASRLGAIKLEPDEIVQLGSLDHDNIIKFYGTSLQDQNLWFITEFATNLSVHDFIHVNHREPEFERSLIWARQIAEGMCYLHQQKPCVVHRDLKPSNVLLTEELTAKICDFGFVKFLEYATIRTLAGTYRWMAPEIMQQEKTTRYCDVFSYGMVLWELLNYKQPFAELSDLDVRQNVLNRKRPSIPNTPPRNTRYLYDLMQICWKTDHKARPSFEKILDALKNKKGTLVLKIEDRELQKGKELGAGGFGKVWKGSWKSRQVEVAIKQVLDKTKFQEEVEVIMVLDHPNIIQLYGAVHTPNFCIVTEYAEKGSLFDRLYKQKAPINMDQSLLWAKQIAEGMKYLHENDLVHRDLKSSNVLLTTEKTSSEIIVKICDFGCAKFLDGTVAKTFTGTFKWMAPEILRMEKASFPCDVFSYGMVLWELLERKEPFEGDNEVDAASKIKRGERPPISEHHEEYLTSMLENCWKDKPEDRPTFADILTTLCDPPAAAE